MNLSELKFSVQTQELLDAKKAIDGIASSMRDLNKATADETKSALDNEKVKQAQAKTTEAAAKAAKALSDAKSAEDRANKVATESTRSNASVLERQQSILNFMTQGYSKGQASVLAYAQASGSATEEIKELGNVLDVQRKLMGASPFDKSMSGLVALKNQYGEVREAIRQYNADSGLTANQTRELARDKERIIEKLKQEGAGLTQIKQAIREYNSAYIDTAARVNNLSKAEKDRERVMRDTANATRNIQAAEERLFATVSHLGDVQSNNVKVNERAALALGSYERNLRLAGITGEEAAKKLAKFKAAQEQVSAAEAKNRASYVARGVGVQLGDVGVSLASGMNPLIVAVQQGDQLRGLIQQSGLEATQMAGIMQQAFKGIITSFKDVGVAMGSFVVGGIKSTGEAAVGLIAKFDPLTKMLTRFKETQLSSAEDTKRFAGTIALLDGIVVAVGVSLVSLAAIIGAVGIAMYKTAKDNDALLVSIVTTGASLGMTSDEVAKYSERMNSFGNSASDLKVAIASLASEGFKYKDSLDVITQAAQRYARVTGKELNDVLKEYAKVAKDPIDSLVKLGEATGLVDVATLDSVQTMLLAGDTAGATKLALEAYANAQVTAAQDIERGLSPLGSLYLEIKDQASDAWDSISEIANSQPIVDGIKGISLAIVSLIGVAREIGITFNHSALAIYRFLNPFEKFDPRQAWKDYTQELNDANAKTTELMNNIIFGKGPSANRGSGSAGATLWDNLNKSQKEYSTELEKHEQKMAVFRKYRQDAEKTYANDLVQKEKALKVIAGLESAEIKRYEESQKKREKGSTRTKSSPVDNSYAQALERISDLNIKNTQTTDQNSKAQQLFLDIVSSPLWNKWSDTQRQYVANEIEKAHAIEVANNQLKLQKQFSEEINKLQSDYQIAARNELDEIANKAKLIGLTENEKTLLEAKLKVEKERKTLLDQINAAYEKSLAAGNSPFEAMATRQSAINLANANADKKGLSIQEQTRLYLEQSQSFTAGWNEAFAAYRSNLENTANIGSSIFTTLSDGFTSAFLDFVNGTKTASEAFKSFAQSIVQEMLKIAAQQIALKAIGGIFGMLGGGGSDPLNFGAGMATVRLGAAMGLPFSSGGYTGPGGVNQPAGVVHKGEIVWSQKDIAKAGGVGVVEAMRKGINGYASGGLVTYPSVVPNINVNVPAANQDSRMQPVVNTTNNFILEEPQSRRTQNQIARKSAIEERKALGRLG